MYSEDEPSCTRPRRARALALALIAWIGLGFAVALITAAPASAATTTVMNQGQKLLPGHAVTSATVQAACDSYYWELRLQTDGNLVERQVFPCLGTQAVYWQTRTGQKPQYLLLNSVGDLVLVNASGDRVWQTQTGGLGVTHLAIGGDGNMRMLNSNGGAEWSSRWGICAEVPITNGKASTLVSTACRTRGTPYCFGGGTIKGPSDCGIDCSGLTMYAVYQATYKELAHSAYTQSNGGTSIAKADLLPGDLVFFYGADSPHPGHVGIYIGNGDLVDAFDTGYNVTIHSIAWENTHGSQRPGSNSNYMGAARYW